MKSNFNKIFGISFIIAFLLLVAIEWFINNNIKTEHILGWAFVSISIAALAGILLKNKEHIH